MPEIKLNRPVTHDGQTYATINLDEPTLGAVEAFENTLLKTGSEVSGMIALLAVDSGLSEAVIRKIKKSDLASITEALAPFLEEDGGSGAPMPLK